VSKTPTEAYIRIWEKLVDIHIFHETLKQQRLRHFITAQLALGAGWAIATRAALEGGGFEILILQVMALLAAISGFIYACKMKIMNKRASDYVKAIKNQLQDIERILKPTLPGLLLLPYQGQYAALNEGTHKLSPNGYEKANDNNGPVSKQNLASAQEDCIISVMKWTWAVLAILSTVILICGLAFLAGEFICACLTKPALQPR